jgi:hypothetical protein
MTMCPNRFCLVLASVLYAAGAQAHEGHQHAPPEIAMPIAPAGGGYSVSGHGETFEATLHHGAFNPGDTVEMTLFLAEWSTNAPVADAEVALEVTGPDLKAKLTPTALDAPGQYRFEIRLPAAGPYAVLVEVNRGADFDLVPVDGLRAPEADPEAALHDPEDHGLHLHTEEAAGIAIAAVVLLFCAYFLGHWQGRRNARENLS